LLKVCTDNFADSLGARPISEAHFLRLMIRMKCAMVANAKPDWGLVGAVHCPLCALKLASYVL